MTKFYVAQIDDVIHGNAEEFPAPVVAIHPAWNRAGLYHDLFFAPLGDYAPSFEADMNLYWDLKMKALGEQRAAVRAVPTIAWQAPAIKF